MNRMTEKIRKNSKIVKILLRIVFVVLIIVMSVELIALVRAVFANGFEAFSPAAETSAVTLETIVGDPAVFGRAYPLSLVFALFLQAFFLAAIYYAESVFRLIEKSQSPFMTEIPKRMKRIAILLLLAQIVPRFLSYIIRFASVGNFNITIVDEGTAIMIIIAMILYCFAAVFEYGCVLQRESDETL